MKKERFIKKRVAGILGLVLSTLIFSFLMASKTGMVLDEVLVLFFLDFVFLAVFIYFLEEERLASHLLKGESDDFKSICLIYLLGMAGTYLASWLPEYGSIAFFFAIGMTLAANRETAVVTGIFFNLVSAFALNQDIHVLMASILFTLLGVMLVYASREKQFHLWVQFIVFFGTIVIIISCYYAQHLVIKGSAFITAALMGGANLVFLEFTDRVLFPKTEQIQETVYTGLLREDYPLVQSIRRFSEIDYSHAVRVSNLCGECANLLGLDIDLCRTAGFYYRIGRMEGEPYIENGVTLAENACFPPDVIQILKEYNGELEPISTKESAVVHMVDKVITKLDVLDKRTFSTNWNQDMVIYQTLNENSSTGIYDESGLSMNQFLRIRDFLVKGERLF
ncbi:MAG: hypothetical protein ACI4C5_06855 [Lachnospiraceae bacterium]